jgi:hypothetical protein
MREFTPPYQLLDAADVANLQVPEDWERLLQFRITFLKGTSERNGGQSRNSIETYR